MNFSSGGAAGLARFVRRMPSLPVLSLSGQLCAANLGAPVREFVLPPVRRVSGILSKRSRGATVACRSLLAMGAEMVVEGPQVIKAASDQRLYEVFKLPNGLSALLIHDPAMAGSHAHPGEPTSGHGKDSEDEEEDDDDDDENDDESGSEGDDGEDDEDEMEVDGCRDHEHNPRHVHHAGCNHGEFLLYFVPYLGYCSVTCASES